MGRLKPRGIAYDDVVPEEGERLRHWVTSVFDATKSRWFVLDAPHA